MCVIFIKAHKGMLSSAKYIKKELEDYGVLDKAYAIYPDYKLVITGNAFSCSFVPNA